VVTTRDEAAARSRQVVDEVREEPRKVVIQNLAGLPVQVSLEVVEDEGERIPVQKLDEQAQLVAECNLLAP
jgi:hypothetical protein